MRYRAGLCFWILFSLAAPAGAQTVVDPDVTVSAVVPNGTLSSRPRSASWAPTTSS